METKNREIFRKIYFTYNTEPFIVLHEYTSRDFFRRVAKSPQYFAKYSNPTSRSWNLLVSRLIPSLVCTALPPLPVSFLLFPRITSSSLRFPRFHEYN
mgnify:CR=1 FL=1